MGHPEGLVGGGEGCAPLGIIEAELWKSHSWEQTGIWVLYKVSKPLFEGWWTGSSMFVV